MALCLPPVGDRFPSDSQPAGVSHGIKPTDESTRTLNHVKDVSLAFRVCVAL